MARYDNIDWPDDALLMAAPFDPHLHAESSKARLGRCLWADHDAPAEWSAVWNGERWSVCSEHLSALAAAELAPTPPTSKSLADRFQAYILGDVDALKGRGYNPHLFLAMVRDHGAVGAAKRLLADPRHTSYGFQKLWDLGELERSVEFAVSLSWFNPLFTQEEIDEAERRLVLHDFPLRERLAAREAHPPDWPT
jgi:hypothetical protein